MPTPPFISFPPATPFEEFESMTRDGMALDWESPTLQKNGRPGQKQHGVDVFGPDHLGRPVAIQCKRYEGELKIATVTEEIGNAEDFVSEGKLNCLYIATTAPRDAKLQKAVRVLSEERVKQGKFAVGLLYWDDILRGLLRDPQVFKSHFPYMTLPGSEPSPDENDSKPKALSLGYYGRFLWHYIDLAFGEFGWMANQDPEEVRTIIRLVRAGAEFLGPEVKTELVAWTQEIEQKIFPATDKDKIDWEEIKLIAQRVEERVKYLPFMHANKAEARFIDFGLSLGYINWHEGDFTTSQADKITSKFRQLIPGAMLDLQDTLGRLQGKDCYSAGPILMTLADRELKWPSDTDA